MKLSAPPPPPEPGPDSNPPPPPEPTPSPEPIAPPAAEARPAKQALWPAWFAGADLLLGVLVLAVAFLAASFIAQNSDVWLHLASGKKLTTGEYHLGSDPFSYTGADRTWINHSWLFDLAAFKLYRGDGFTLALVKALVVVAAFALILAIRRPGHALWPWVVFTAIGVLAAANQFWLRPFVLSIFFLALTLWLVFRMPNRPDSWRLPIAIGITFCLWSNIDEWFFLGPATLALLTLGDFMRQRFSAGAIAADEPTDPLGTLPDLRTLFRATLVGIVACMLNPHHVGVWELPFVLVGAPAGAEIDVRIRYLFVSPLYRESNIFWTDTGAGRNANGVAYAILLAAGLYSVFLSALVGRFFGRAAEVEPLPVPHALLWFGFAILSLLTMYAIPFFALVTIPLVASRWNVFSGRLVLGSGNDARTRLLLTLSAVGRVVCAAALIALGVVAWPGKLHAPASCWWNTAPSHPLKNKRVAWAVEPDIEFQKAAEWLQKEHAEGRLADDVHGLLLSVDLANYCAWFAPSEKVFANGRWKFHRGEWLDLARAKRGLDEFGERADALERQDAVEVLERWRARYVGIAVVADDPRSGGIILNVTTLSDMWLDPVHWSTWFFNGRTAISGWRPGPGPGLADPTFQRLTVSPVDLAYGPSVAVLPVVPVRQPILARDEWEEFVVPKRPTPAGVDETFAWIRFKEIAQQQNFFRRLAASLLLTNQPSIGAPALGPAWLDFIHERLAPANQLQFPPPADGSFQAIAIIKVRAARRAIAENPDHPDGYFALGESLNDSDLPINASERAVARITAYRQCLSRMPPPGEYRRGIYRTPPTDVALSLAQLYLEPSAFQRIPINRGIPVNLEGIVQLTGEHLYTRGAIVQRMSIHQQPRGGDWVLLQSSPSLLPLDLGREAFDIALKYGPMGSVRPQWQVPPEEFAKGMEQRRNSFTRDWESSARMVRAAADRPGARVRDRFQAALRAHFVGEAINIFHQARQNRDDFKSEFGAEAATVALQAIALELVVGRLEDAIDDLAWTSELIDEHVQQAKSDPNQNRALIGMFSRIMYQKLFLEGDYEGAGKELEQLEGRQIADLRGRKLPSPSDTEKPELVFPPLNDMSPVMAVGLTSFRAHLKFRNVQTVLLEQLRVSQDFFFRRGFLSLLAGDIPGARARLKEVAYPAIPEWKISAYTLPAAPVYLRGIEAARKGR
ncbi:MAG TPA: hypothetical protein VN641_14865 [Urbifossiella sp.]|nr:hypothetical protein [Urbifossiella sp.]